ncbi:MAG: hypothetical protein DRO36_06200 [Candidatus Hecatellales archaeon]|nr:MAG: hypothetical protein DRO36_06200 [Candidatus Hecatellales archaeon]
MPPSCGCVWQQVRQDLARRVYLRMPDKIESDPLPYPSLLGTFHDHPVDAPVAHRFRLLPRVEGYPERSFGILSEGMDAQPGEEQGH